MELRELCRDNKSKLFSILRNKQNKQTAYHITNKPQSVTSPVLKTFLLRRTVTVGESFRNC